MVRILISFFIAFGLAIGFSTACAGAAEPILHVIIAVDGHVAPRANLDADSRNMERVFRDNIPQTRLNLLVLDAERVTPKSIFESISQLNVGENDTLVFYFSGHAAGGTPDDAINGGHFFQFKTENGQTTNLRRSALLARMKEKKPRLTVLLTDGSNVEEKPIGVLKSLQAQNRSMVKSPEKISPLFQTLFFQSEGVVNITSSRRGEASCVDTTEKIRGSCFTWSLIDLLQEHKSHATMIWPDFVTLLKPAVHQAFQECWPNGYSIHLPAGIQRTQSVEVYGHLPGEASPLLRKGPRFGVRAVTHPGGGVRVTEIMPQSPGSHAGFEVGDVILEINEKKVNDENEYSLAIDQSPKNVMMKVVNVKDKNVLEVRFELGY